MVESECSEPLELDYILQSSGISQLIRIERAPMSYLATRLCIDYQVISTLIKELTLPKLCLLKVSIEKSYSQNML